MADSVATRVARRDYVNKLPYPLMADYKDYDTWLVDHSTYSKENVRLREQFCADLIEEAGVIGHPKANKAFDMAWDRGHASGYHEVEYEFAEIAELLKD